ncbi:hypothetical protein D3C72_511260 [compost metagenome]
MFPNAGIMAAGAAPSTPYATWLAYVNGKSGVGSRAWGASNVIATGLYRVTCNATDSLSTHTLYGSSWMSTFRLQTGVTYTSRLIQHALPSELEFNAQRNAGKIVLVEFGGSVTPGPALSRDRNGFLSTADGNRSSTLSLIAWHDEAAQQVLMSNPYAGTAPVPYAAADWT